MTKKQPQYPWKRTVREKTSLVMHVCDHNFEHPAYGSAHYLHHKTGIGTIESWMSHDCDGCCKTDKWQAASIKNSAEVSNHFILKFQEQLEDARLDLIVANNDRKELLDKIALLERTNYLGVGQV